MRIDQSSSNAVQNSEVHGAKGAKKTHGAKHSHHAEGANEKGEHSGATAEVSDRAREMAHAKSAATEAPDTRDDRIAELKARIAGGNYKVDSHAVADRMVDDHIRMSGIG